MSRRVTFYLGPAVSLTSRRVTITRQAISGDDTLPSPAHDVTLGGTVENYSVALPDNTMWQAKLVDTRSSGEVGNPTILNFHTGTLQFPGPGASHGNTLFGILSMEDKSSSSSSVTSSSSSKSSVTSSSSSSNSSSSSKSSATSSSSSSSKSSVTSSSSSSPSSVTSSSSSSSRSSVTSSSSSSSNSSSSSSSQGSSASSSSSSSSSSSL